MTSRRPSAAIGGRVHGSADPVAHRHQPRQLVEPVEEVGAHGRDHEQRAVGIVQCGGEQPVEPAPLRRVGEGEQLLELVDGEQEGGVVLLAAAQPVGEAAVVGLQQPADLGHLGGEGAGELLGQHRHRACPRHHRPDPPPVRDAGARPQPALVDQRQEPGVHQRGLARAAVAVDLQPAHRRVPRPRVEAGQRVEGLLLPAEEQLRLVDPVGREPDERAALEGDLVVGDDGPRRGSARPVRCGSAIDAVPGRRLEQAQEGRQRLGRRAVDQDREDGQALGLVVRPEVAVQRHLGLGPDPARHAVAADQHDEAAAAAHRLLQPVQPEIAGADALVVAEHRQPMPLELGAQVERRRPVVVAVAQEDVAAGHQLARQGQVIPTLTGTLRPVVPGRPARAPNSSMTTALQSSRQLIAACIAARRSCRSLKVEPRKILNIGADGRSQSE